MHIRTFIAVALFLGLASPLIAQSAGASPVPAGGSNQRASLEGCIGQTLFNGLWRLTVLKSELVTNPDDEDFKNWGITLEVRNGKNATNSPSDSGFDEYPQLGFSDGTVLDMATTDAKVQYQKAIFYKDLPPGGVARMTMFYRLEGDDAGKTPTKLLIAIKPSGPNGKFGYSVSDPSFRVKLDCHG